jgi:hypothetical protein
MICLIDPALQDHTGRPSDNLGDVVIYRAIAHCFAALFPGEEVCRISSHEPLEECHYEILNAARLVFLGGSNMVSSDVLAYNQWNFTAQRADYDAPRMKNAILLGIGWWQYQDPPTPFTSAFYRRVLSGQQLHSVRDHYTQRQLSEAGIQNVVTTGCPSIWGLTGVTNHRKDRWTEDCLVMLTDYYTNPGDDDAFLRLVADHFRGNLFFFPQGTGDLEYIQTLPVFQANRGRFEILDRSLDGLTRFLAEHPVTYVGTRLHGGITAMRSRVPSLILGVDNRGLEKARSFNLPVVARTDLAKIRRWLRGQKLFEPVTVPLENVARWWSQFQPESGLTHALEVLRPKVDPPALVSRAESRVKACLRRW